MRVYKLIIISLLIIWGINLKAQKVGLVLSGGGAKGLAHIGVIRALEQNNIPIDYITGTSIGAIVGGLYAAGYSPDEMEELVSAPEFENWTKGVLEDKFMYFFKKEDDNASWISLKIANDSTKKAYLPTNIFSNHQMDFAFLEVWSQAAATAKYNFDSLFIPFRCVAADIHDKKTIVFKNGDLATAIRSSMSLPLIYKPIEFEKMLLFDGGIYNNFPADVMNNDFKPEIIIGCKVTSNTVKPDQDDLISQVLNMILDKTDFNIEKNKGFMIEPDISNITMLDFDKLKLLSSNGYKATMEKMDSIKTLITRRVYLVELEKRRKAFKQKLPKLFIDSIAIKGLNPKQSKYINNTIKRERKTLTVEQLKSEYFKLIVDGNIDYIYPTAKYNENTGFFNVLFKIKQAKSFTAKIGGNISSASINEGFAEIEYKYLTDKAFRLNANIYFGRFYNSIFAKGRIDVPKKLPYFVDASLTYNHWDYITSNPNVFYDDDRPSYLVHNETNFQSNLGFPINRRALLRFGISFATNNYRYYQTSYFKTTDTADVMRFSYISPSFTYHENTTNHKQYSDKGTELYFQVRYIAGIERNYPGSTSVIRDENRADHGYFQFKLMYNNYAHISKKLSLGIYLEGFHSYQNYYYDYYSTIISANAFQPIPYSKTMIFDNFKSNTYIAGGLKSIYRMTKDFHFRAEAYLYQPYKVIEKTADAIGRYVPTNRTAFATRYYIGTAGIVYHTPAGPASFMLNYFENSSNKWYLVFNFGYILFNRKGND